MKYPLYLLAALALAACTGPAGNPGGQPYADAPGGVLAVRPEPAPAVAYNPNTVPPSFDDMQIRPAALNPLPGPPPAPPPVYSPPRR